MYVVVAYVTYALLAVMASALLLAPCVAVLMVQEAVRIVRRTLHRARERNESGAKGVLVSLKRDSVPKQASDAFGVRGSAL